MQKLLAISLLTLLTSCGGGCGGDAAPIQAPEVTQPPSAPALPIKAGSYESLGPLFGGGHVVEASYYPNPAGSYSLFFQCADNKTCRIADFVDTQENSAGKVTVDTICRFPSFFADQGAHYMVCGNQPGDGDIYLYRSSDLETWAIQNGGQPIVRRTPGTQWERIWNVAILPVGGRWHMLAETAPAVHPRGGMDIAYAWSDPAVSLDFTPNQGPVVIANAGNPEMFYKNGKMVAVHGMYHDRSLTDPWYTTMSTADPASPQAWTVHRDKLMIEQPGIDVCDPSYIEVDGKGLIAVSYDQNKVLQLRGPVLNP